MSLRFYYDLLSQPCRALYIFFKLNNIPFESKIVSIGAGEHLTTEFEKLNPLKKLPIIEHNREVLTESIAIVRYISREFPIHSQWYPSDSRAQSKVDEYLEWQHLNTRLHCSSLFLTQFLRPKLTGKPADPRVVKKCEERVVRCLDEIENIWLKDRPFITGDKINVADLFAACEIEHVRMVGFDPRENRPVLTAWLARVERETNPHYRLAHKFVDKIAENSGGTNSPRTSKL